MSIDAYFQALEARLIAAIRAELATIVAAIEHKPAKATKAKAAPEPASAPATPAVAAATAPAAAPEAPAAAAPTYPSFDTLKKAVLALAGTQRDAAVKILASFKVVNASELKPEQYQAVIDAMEEKKAEIDAAASKASLV